MRRNVVEALREAQLSELELELERKRERLEPPAGDMTVLECALRWACYTVRSRKY